MNKIELEEAYRQTSYIAWLPDERADKAQLVIRIGGVHPTLDELLEDRALRDWAFITAWNPGSEMISASKNVARQKRLRKRVDALGFDYFEGEGGGESGEWTPERSLLVLGIPRAEAVALGRDFGQNAIVCGTVGQPAELIWCEKA